jgi:hypothetical protein
MRLDLSEAIRLKMVTLTEVKATGQSYKAKALRIKLENRSGSDILIKMNTGVVFKPTDPAYQPLLLAGDEPVMLAALKTAEADVQTFCADADASAPDKDLVYEFSHMASDTMVKLLQWVKKNHLFTDLGQHGVWVLTNDHSLERVYDVSRDLISKQFVEFLSALTGKPKPAYYVISDINETPGQPVYTPKALKIFAQFEQVLTAPAKLTLGVFNEEGTMVQPVFENRSFGKSGHRFRVEFEAADVPAGNYYIRLLEGARVLQETKVKVD